MDQTSKHVRSSKTYQPISHDDDKQDPNNDPTHNVFATIEEIGKVYTKQMGRFPIRSSAGNQYILVLYDYDSNAILTEALKTIQGPEIIKAYTKTIQYLQGCGFHPQVHCLDNEASNTMKAYSQANHIEYQLVPPHMHRNNAAEQAIRTWKNHFIAGLCSTDSQFPMHLWCCVLPQATLTLNMLRASLRNPQISACTVLEGVFDFNKTPLSEPGTKVVLHEKPSKRLSWDPHGTDGWYLGPAL